MINLKKELSDVKTLALSNWVRSGVVLWAIAGLIVGFFAIDLKWRGGDALFSLMFGGGIDSSGLMFDVLRYGVALLVSSGGICVLIGSVKVAKKENKMQMDTKHTDGEKGI